MINLKIKRKKEKFGVKAVTGRGEKASLVELLGLILARSRTAKLLLFILVIHRNVKYASKWSEETGKWLSSCLCLLTTHRFPAFSRAKVLSNWIEPPGKPRKVSGSEFDPRHDIVTLPWSPKMNRSSRSFSAQ